MPTCAHCGSPTPTDAPACPACGAPVASSAAAAWPAPGVHLAAPPAPGGPWVLPSAAAEAQSQAPADPWVLPSAAAGAPPQAPADPWAPPPVSGLQPATAAGSSTRSLALVVCGAVLVLLSTFLAWDASLSLSGSTYGPALDLGYWRDLALSNLRMFVWYDLVLYLGDVVVTLLAVVAGLLALAGLSTGRYAARLGLVAGVAGLAWFAIELARWMVAHDLVLSLCYSIAGAVLIVVGAGGYRGSSSRR